MTCQNKFDMFDPVLHDRLREELKLSNLLIGDPDHFDNTCYIGYFPSGLDPINVYVILSNDPQLSLLAIIEIASKRKKMKIFDPTSGQPRCFQSDRFAAVFSCRQQLTREIERVMVVANAVSIVMSEDFRYNDRQKSQACLEVIRDPDRIFGA